MPRPKRPREDQCLALTKRRLRCDQGHVPGVVPQLCGIHHNRARRRGLVSLRLPLRVQLLAEALDLKVCHWGTR